MRVCPEEGTQSSSANPSKRCGPDRREREYSRQIVLTTVFLEIMRPYLYEEPPS